MAELVVSTDLTTEQPKGRSEIKVDSGDAARIAVISLCDAVEPPLRGICFASPMLTLLLRVLFG
jgi:hypothetical protein